MTSLSFSNSWSFGSIFWKKSPQNYLPVLLLRWPFLFPDLYFPKLTLVISMCVCYRILPLSHACSIFSLRHLAFMQSIGLLLVFKNPAFLGQLSQSICFLLLSSFQNFIIFRRRVICPPKEVSKWEKRCLPILPLLVGILPFGAEAEWQCGSTQENESCSIIQIDLVLIPNFCWIWEHNTPKDGTLAC